LFSLKIQYLSGLATFLTRQPYQSSLDNLSRSLSSKILSQFKIKKSHFIFKFLIAAQVHFSSHCSIYVIFIFLYLSLKRFLNKDCLYFTTIINSSTYQANESSVYSIIGFQKILISGFGIVSVNGLSLEPSQAASITAFIINIFR
jgi:hypothetical protein